MAAQRGKPQMVEVKWLDAETKYVQMSLKKARKKCVLSERLSLGYIVLKDRERLILAHTYDPADPAKSDSEERGADFTTIPRGWVVSITTLQPATEPEKEEA